MINRENQLANQWAPTILVRQSVGSYYSCSPICELLHQLRSFAKVQTQGSNCERNLFPFTNIVPTIQLTLFILALFHDYK
jgi:hypothetical protein